jgi:hypothetical protein
MAVAERPASTVLRLCQGLTVPLAGTTTVALTSYVGFGRIVGLGRALGRLGTGLSSREDPHRLTPKGLLT